MVGAAAEVKHKHHQKVTKLVGVYKNIGVQCPAENIIIPPARYGWRYWKTIPGILKFLQMILPLISFGVAIPSCYATQHPRSHKCRPKEMQMDEFFNLYNASDPKLYDYCFSDLLFWYDKKGTAVKIVFWILMSGVAAVGGIFVFIQQCRYTTFSAFYRKALLRYHLIFFLLLDVAASFAAFNHFYYYNANHFILPHLNFVITGAICCYISSLAHGLSSYWNFFIDNP